MSPLKAAAHANPASGSDGNARLAPASARPARSGEVVRIQVLGRFAMFQGDGAVTFGRKPPRKPLALLKLLIATGGLGADTTSLAADLWPEAQGDAAQRAFDITLHRLRKLPGMKPLLTVSDGKLSFDCATCCIDVWEFEALVERIEAAVWTPAPADAPGHGRLASDLLRIYAGHFLEHETAEAWAVSCRDRLRAKFARAVTILAASLERQGDWQQAAALYARALELDNLAESIYRRLMICYRELGETAEAIRVYRRCRDLLSVVLSVKPSAETEAICATFR